MVLSDSDGNNLYMVVFLESHTRVWIQLDIVPVSGETQVNFEYEHG